jgi:hypothetical protein
LQVIYSDGNEQEPIEGNTYIVFIYTYPFDQIARAIKLLPANPETVKEVVAAIAASKQQLPPRLVIAAEDPTAKRSGFNI